MARGRSRRAVDWDAVARVEPFIEDEVEDEAGAALAAGGSHDGVHVSGEVRDADETVVLDGASLLDCRVTDCVWPSLSLRDARLTTCVLEGLRSTTTGARGSTWSDIVVQGSRLGALDLSAATLRRTTLRDCRLDYVNLRGATLAQVQLVDCVVGELDLGTAQATDVRLPGSRIGRLDVTNARLDEVDLRGARLDAVDGVAGLSGALVSEEQLLALAPLLAGALGIRLVRQDRAAGSSAG